MGNQTLAKAPSTFSRRDSAQKRPRAPLSAAHPLLNLQRAVGNQATQRLLRSGVILSAPIHAAGSGPIIQRQTGTDYGLASAASQNKYVAEAVKLWTTKKSMRIKDFVNTLMKGIKADLQGQGVPELKWKMVSRTGVAGTFDQKAWIVNIDPSAFTKRKGITITEASALSALTDAEVVEVVGTLYHESRHTDQDVLIVRMLLDKKTSVNDIVKSTMIPARIVNAVKAAKFPAAVTAAQAAHAQRMFDLMYGQHKELLTFMLANTKLIGAVQAIAEAETDAEFNKAIAAAQPFKKTLEQWATTVLAPKVKALKASGAIPTLTTDLDNLSTITTQLLTDFDSHSKKPTDDTLADLEDSAIKWTNTLDQAWRNLESEKEAIDIETAVKAAFQKGVAAAPPPKQAPKKVPAKKK